MIKRLVLKNFRTHRLLKLKLEAGVNVFYGKTGAGKSNIFRAIYFLSENKPASTGVLTKSLPAGVCKVFVETWEGTGVSLTRTIEASKSGGKKLAGAKYKVAAVGEELKISEALGREVPDNVRAVLSMDSLNFQKQLDPHYLILSSAGEIMREINRITRLETLDDINRGLTHKIRLARARIDALKEEAKQSKEKLEKLPRTKLAEEMLARAKKAEKKAGQVQDKIYTTREYIRAVKLAKKFPGMAEIDGFKKSLDDIASALDGSVEEIVRVKKYISAEREYEGAAVEVGMAREAFEAALLEGKKCPVCAAPIDRKQARKIAREAGE
jgi:DNA repair exonuclease SbcCD ATPase subunit